MALPIDGLQEINRDFKFEEAGAGQRGTAVWKFGTETTDRPAVQRLAPAWLHRMDFSSARWLRQSSSVFVGMWLLVCRRPLLVSYSFGLAPRRSYRMFWSSCYTFITSPNWQSYSTSELLNLISLVVIISIGFILFMSLAAGVMALALSVVFLIRSFLEGSAPGIQFGKRMLRLSSTGQPRNPEVENKTSAPAWGEREK